MFDFEACSCGRHGRFNTSYAKKDFRGHAIVIEIVASGHEIATKEDAKAFIQNAFARGVIDLATASSLAIRIEGSSLAENEDAADPVVLTAARDWNLQLVTVNEPKAFLSARPKQCLVRASAT